MEIFFSNSKKFKSDVSKKNQSVVNELFYPFLNFHHEISCTLSSVKIKLQI
jgi:hypothetical protein